MDMRASRWIGPIAALTLAGWMGTAVVAQGGGQVAGAGAAPFPAGTTFSLVTLSGLQFGLGAAIDGNGVATGDLHVTLLGTSALGEARQITFDGRVTTVSVVQGIATLTGTGTQDLGDGSVPIGGVPFTATATASTLVLVLGTTLPGVTLSSGAITIK
jgi:hypothetical protein